MFGGSKLNTHADTPRWLERLALAGEDIVAAMTTDMLVDLVETFPFWFNIVTP